MFGMIYLLLCMLLGREIAEDIYFKNIKTDRGNRIWILLPASFGIGTLVQTWAVYLVSWAVENVTGSRRPLYLGNLITMSATVIFLVAAGFLRRYFKRSAAGRTQESITKHDREKAGLVRRKQLFWRELLFFLLLAAFLTWIFFYVFFISGGRLYSGLTVFSDYAPHTAMIRSFSKGNNFPTQYPHYGGEDVKYHFMFQFLVGNLEYLGLRLDIAYNLVSILSLLFMLMLLYRLTQRVMGGFAAGVTACVLFFFRSGLTFFRFVWEHWRLGDLWETLSANTSFIGYTENENWGLWCFNVYLNQRHLAFGLLIVGLLLWMFLDWMEEADAREETGLRWMRERWLTPEAWKCKNLFAALMAGILLGLASFWNGAAVIGGLLILAGFAVSSDHKLDFLAMAVVTVLLSSVQVRMFMDSSATSFSFHWGLLADNKSLPGVLWYLIQISGFFFLGLAVFCLFLTRIQRMAMFGFLIPVVFAFTISLTPDIAVNHKYVLISYAFLTMFWAWGLVRLWGKRRGWRLMAGILLIALTLTGVYDFVIVVRNNGHGHRISVDMEDPAMQWLVEHLDSRELLLTPPYSMNEVTLSGVMLYCGWPYYAWSAGYDTDTRFRNAKEIYSSADPDRVRELVEEEGITYILLDGQEASYDGVEMHEEVIAQLYQLVYTGENERIRIYDTSQIQRSDES